MDETRLPKEDHLWPSILLVCAKSDVKIICIFNIIPKYGLKIDAKRENTEN